MKKYFFVALAAFLVNASGVAAYASSQKRINPISSKVELCFENASGKKDKSNNVSIGKSVWECVKQDATVLDVDVSRIGIIERYEQIIDEKIIKRCFDEQSGHSLKCYYAEYFIYDFILNQIYQTKIKNSKAANGDKEYLQELKETQEAWTKAKEKECAKTEINETDRIMCFIKKTKERMKFLYNS